MTGCFTRHLCQDSPNRVADYAIGAPILRLQHLQQGLTLRQAVVVMHDLEIDAGLSGRFLCSACLLLLEVLCSHRERDYKTKPFHQLSSKPANREHRPKNHTFRQQYCTACITCIVIEEIATLTLVGSGWQIFFAPKRLQTRSRARDKQPKAPG